MQLFPPLAHSGALRALVMALCACSTRSAGDTAGSPRPPVMVFAASSTAQVVEEILVRFERARGIPCRASFAASSALARQIEQGAPADLFLSAHAKWTRYLIDQDLLDAASLRVVASNRLVWIEPRETSTGVPLAEWLESRERIAIGDPDHVPAGLYAIEALTHLGLYEALRSRLVATANVRAALVLVERGECDAGIVYASDARVSDRIRVREALPETSHSPIEYPLAVLRNAPQAALDLAEFFLSAEAQEILRDAGFGRPGGIEPPDGPP